MLGGYKLIGICITRIEDESCRSFLDAMKRQAEEQHARLLVFNSFLDFYYGNEQEQGAKAVYELINYDLLDALVIVDQRFFDKELVRHMVDEAHAHQLPVIVLNAHYDGCYAIDRSCTEAFSGLIAHVLEKHAPQTIGYIAGSREARHTKERLAIFRSTMAAHGRAVDERMIAFCDDWTEPVYRAVDQWYNEGRIPRAIICASDIMASAACDQLEAHGLQVPADVIVTGFDGLESLRLYTPTLTTCEENMAERVRIIFEMIAHAMAGGQPYEQEETYRLLISESCCGDHRCEVDVRAGAQALFRMLDDHLHHEQNLFSTADTLLRSREPHMAFRALQQSLLPNSALILNPDILYSLDPQAAPPSQPFNGQMIVMDAVERKAAPTPTHRMNLGDMFPNLMEVIHQNVIFCFTAIFIGERVVGYLAARIDRILSQPHKIRRLCRILNMEFTVMLTRVRQEYMASSMQSIDPVTGLMNLKGLSMYLDDHYEELKKQCIAVSVYNIAAYQHMLEEKGLDFAEQNAVVVSELLRRADMEHTLLARVSSSDFLSIDLGEQSDAISHQLDQRIQAFYEGLEKHNAMLAGDEAALEVQSGCVVTLPGWSNNLASLIKAANAEMYMNRMKQSSQRTREGHSGHVDSRLLLHRLLEQNLFCYHFQPIVNAHTGEIEGYEALMRTREPLRMAPAQILGLAERQQRLYDIERMTLFNVMAYVDAHPGQFTGKRVFINTIPGYFLNEKDRELLTARYSHLFDSVTVEITESGDTDDAELRSIRRLEHEGKTCQLAIDDYGTGFSNIVNLLRYQPQVIKIDRYLVENVHRDPNKQLFIRSTVEFARLNGIKVLAEGVETRAELSKVIELGVDLVQGYYLGRPSEMVQPAVGDEVKHFMIEETLRFSRFGMQEKVYHAESGERLDLLQLALEKYTSIELQQGSCTVVGQPDHFFNIYITSTPASTVQLYLEDVFISAQRPAVSLGPQSSMVMILCGRNAFDQEGIYVPETASLLMGGEGSLDIHNLQQKGVVLGANEDDAFGHIRVDMTGQLTLHAESETSICIGGGRKGCSAPIEMISGDVQLAAKGIRSVAVGCLYGDVNVVLGPRVTVHAEVIGNEAVGIGTLSGTVDITNNARLDMTIEGERITGVGVLGRGDGCVRMSGPFTHMAARGENAACVGSLQGDTDVICSAEMISIYMEGARACGLGCMHGSGRTFMKGGVFKGCILSGVPVYLGRQPVISGGSVEIHGDGSAEGIHAVNESGEALVPVKLEGGEKVALSIGEGSSRYVYRAVCPPETAAYIYLPSAAVRMLAAESEQP